MLSADATAQQMSQAFLHLKQCFCNLQILLFLLQPLCHKTLSHKAAKQSSNVIDHDERIGLLKMFVHFLLKC